MKIKSCTDSSECETRKIKDGFLKSLKSRPPSPTPPTRPMTSYPPAACRASCLAEGGDGADGWEDERRDKEAFGKRRECGTARVSTVRREENTAGFPWLLRLSPNRRRKCRPPVVSWARAGPSRPGRCWSTTQRSYLMIIAPPPEALYSLPLPEVSRAPVSLGIFPLTEEEVGRVSWAPALSTGSLNHSASCSCRCGLGCLVISIKTKTKTSPAPLASGCCLIGWFAAQRFLTKALLPKTGEKQTMSKTSVEKELF